MTIIELMVGTALLVGGGGAILVGMHYAMIHSDYLTHYQMAMDAVQSRVDEVAANTADDFVAVATGVTYPGAVTATGQCMGLREDLNCNGVLDAGEDLNVNGVLDEPVLNARLHVMVTEADGTTPDANSTLLDIHVAACWSTRGRIVGEDLDCDGRLDAGEDANGNGWLDSPAMAHTRISLGDG